MFNEQEAFPRMVARLRPALDGLGESYEVVAVDDGSTDGTAALLHGMRRTWRQLRVVGLRRNSGHQAALAAGLRVATGQYVVSIDADLQDPPETIADMLRLAQQENLDIVYGVRSDRRSDSIGKRLTAAIYYRVMNRLVPSRVPRHAGDFRLLSRATVDVLRALPEHQPVYRMLVPWLGFPSGEVRYVREKRVAGRTKYPVSRMIRLAVDSVTNFSVAPLRIATWLGLMGFMTCLALLAYTIVVYALGRALPGWTSTVVVVIFIGAVQLLCVGLLGEYIGRIYSAQQGRPVFFIAYDTAEFPMPEQPVPTAVRDAAGVQATSQW
jgi:polyisoprenyl-phosphate glycosyltransferase